MSNFMYVAVKILNTAQFQIIGCNYESAANEVLKIWEAEFLKSNPSGTIKSSLDQDGTVCKTFTIRKTEAVRSWLVFSQEVHSDQEYARCYVARCPVTSDRITEIGEYRHIKNVLQTK